MPESAGPDAQRDVEHALDRLAALVDRVASEVEGAKRRAEGAESEYAELRAAVGSNGGPDSGDLEERLKSVAAENRVLRATLVQARERAERLRSRLAVVEDEV